ncbi:hypothetical protein T05_4071, partial [Trichinella murrelli]
LSSTASILSSSSSVRRRSNRALLAASFLDSDLVAAAIPHGDYGYPLGDACRLRLGGPNAKASGLYDVDSSWPT